jgi:hypothetical protein
VWQLAQPLVTATLVCNLPLAQVVVLPLWQTSQLAVAAAAIDAYGTWLPGLPSAGA